MSDTCVLRKKKRNPRALQMNANVNCHLRAFKFHFKNSVLRAKTCPDCLSACQLVRLSDCLLIVGLFVSLLFCLGVYSRSACLSPHFLPRLSPCQHFSLSICLSPYLFYSLYIYIVYILSKYPFVFQLACLSLSLLLYLPVGLTVCLSVCLPVDPTVYLPVSQSLFQSVSQSVSQSVAQSVSQSVLQSVFQSVSQSVSHSVCQSFSLSSRSSFSLYLSFCSVCLPIPLYVCFSVSPPT